MTTSRITPAMLLLTLGAFALSVGLVLGFTPMSLDGGAHCGSAFARIDAFAPDAPLDMSACDAQRNSRLGLALALTIPGALLALGGEATRRKTPATLKLEQPAPQE